jgi:hypothetical protein
MHSMLDSQAAAVTRDLVTAPALEDRLRDAVSIAWQAFARKVGNRTVPVNKEASMQLHYAYLLKQLLPLAIHASDESAEIELEAGVRVPAGPRNADILVKGISGTATCVIAIELKCYRNIASSGGTRGAHDIFMKDVYEDLHVLEEYVAAGIASRGVALVTNDLRRFVHPTKKSGKCWSYDISHGTVFPGGRINTDIGGKPVDVHLKKQYTFEWEQVGDFWFLELEGVDLESSLSAST